MSTRQDTPTAESKFAHNQWVKYDVYGETRYNRIVKPIWNPYIACWTYMLEEPFAMPIHRECDLTLLCGEELDKLKEACYDGRVMYWRTGYLTVKGGL